MEQEPFIISGTLKQNILFGEPFDEDRFAEAVRVCCLEHDLTIFNRGADTEIGERGINASGGQKARISLARAVYADADIYLLDDPLSAVDPDVAGKLFKQCIEGKLKQKCVVLVTHQVQHLKEVQRIILLDNGRVKAQGSYSELKEQGVDFDAILEGYSNKKEAEDKILLKDEEEPVLDSSQEDNDLQSQPILNQVRSYANILISSYCHIKTEKLYLDMH